VQAGVQLLHCPPQRHPRSLRLRRDKHLGALGSATSSDQIG
jgi:hypothetical protein